MMTTDEVLGKTGISYVMLTRLKDFGIIPRPQLQGKGTGGGRGIVGVFPDEVVEVIEWAKSEQRAGLSLSRIAEKWHERRVVSEPSEILEIDYVEVVRPKDKILIPAGAEPVRAYLDGCDPFYEQMRRLYPDYMVSTVDMVTVNIDGRKYYQPGRITMQRIRGVVPPIV